MCTLDSIEDGQSYEWYCPNANAKHIEFIRYPNQLNVFCIRLRMWVAYMHRQSSEKYQLNISMRAIATMVLYDILADCIKWSELKLICTTNRA